MRGAPGGMGFLYRRPARSPGRRKGRGTLARNPTRHTAYLRTPTEAPDEAPTMRGRRQRRPNPMKSEYAWAAGLFEGEGCMSLRRSHGRRTWHPVMFLVSTDRDVVERFCAVLGVGSVDGPRPVAKPHHKPTFGWRVTSWADVIHVLVRIAPWLGDRRFERARELTAELNPDWWLPGYTKRLQTHCKRGHALAGANVGAQNKCLTCERARRKAWLRSETGRAYRERMRANERSRKS